MSGQQVLFVAVLTAAATAVWSPQEATGANTDTAAPHSPQQEVHSTPYHSTFTSGAIYYNLEKKAVLAHSCCGHRPTTTGCSLRQEAPVTPIFDDADLTSTQHTWQQQHPPSGGPTPITKQYDVRKDATRHDCERDQTNCLKWNCLIHAAAQSNHTSRQKRSWEFQKHTAGLQRLQGAAGVSTDAASLSKMLVTVVKWEMTDCDLVLGYDDSYSDPAVLHDLLLLPHPRQVVHIKTTKDLLGVVWVSSGCRGYLLLLDDVSPLLTLTNMDDHHWHHQGRFVLVGVTVDQLEALVGSKKGKKTEHLVGAVQSGTAGEWTLYMNQLFWGQGVSRVNRWLHDRFTAPLDLFPDKLSDLRGAVIKVVTFVWEPNIFYFRGQNGSLVFRYGLDIDITNSLARVLNFLVHFEEPPNEELWGVKTENGSFTGLLGRLARDEAHVGVAILYVIQERMNIIDYSTPFDTEMICFMIRSEPPLPKWQALAFPFQMWTWLASLVCLLISGPLLCLLAQGSARCGEEVGSLLTIASCCYYVFGVHFCEPQTPLPRTATTRVFLLFLWLYTMILTIAYSTNLTAFMVVSRQPMAMETIREIQESGVKVVGIGDFYEHQLASASDPYLQSLSRRYVAYNSTPEIFPQVLEGRAVYLQNRGFQQFVTATRFTSRSGPRVRIMKECFAPFHIAMGLQNHSPLKRKFDEVIGWIQQSGLIRRFFLDSLRLAASTKEYGGSRGEVEEAEDAAAGGVLPLSVDHLQGIFIVLLLGWLISTLIFFLEKSIITD